MNYKDCAKRLLTHENILIVTHKNPDGDTAGSAAAVIGCLLAISIDAAVMNGILLAVIALAIISLIRK